MICKPLFAGKRIDNGEWIYGSYIERQNDGKAYIITSTVGTSCKSEINNMIATGFEVDPKTARPFIGQFDKNNREIFCGDIVLITTDKWPLANNNRHLEVKWCEHNLRFILTCGDNIYNFIRLNKHDIEVVGNIYDNPELL